MFSSKKKGDIRNVWGYSFEWTPEHLTKEQMRPLSYSYDVLGAQVLDRLDELSPPAAKPPSPPEEAETAKEKTQDEEKKPQAPEPQDNAPQSQKTSDEEKPTAARRDLYALLEELHASDPLLSEFHTHITTIPAWVDWEQIARGQAVFYRYGGPSIVSLTFQSLVGGMAGYRVVETLTRTGGFHAKAAKHRLLETFQHILQVTGPDVTSVQPGGEGFKSTLRVRLLHAAVRRRIMALSARDGEGGAGYFDVAQYGVPINDLDCIGTVLSFCAALAWIGLPRQGIFLSTAEIADYHALWRWVGHLLGTPADGWLADWRSGKVFFESLMLADLVPGETGGVLANNILTALSSQPPTFASREFMCAEARWLNGPELSDALGIAESGWWYRVLVGAQCVYFMAVCYVKRLVPAWDVRNRERVRKILYKLTIENKAIGLGQETIFDFKWVPEIGLKTPLGEITVDKHIGESEVRSLATLAMMTAVVGGIAWLVLRSGMRVMGVDGILS